MFDQKKNEAVDAEPAGEASAQMTAPPLTSNSPEASVCLPPQFGATDCNTWLTTR